MCSRNTVTCDTPRSINKKDARLIQVLTISNATGLSFSHSNSSREAPKYQVQITPPHQSGWPLAERTDSRPEEGKHKMNLSVCQQGRAQRVTRTRQPCRRPSMKGSIRSKHTVTEGPWAADDRGHRDLSGVVRPAADKPHKPKHRSVPSPPMNHTSM